MNCKLYQHPGCWREKRGFSRLLLFGLMAVVLATVPVPYAAADYELGLQSFKKKDFRKAANEWQKAANAGHAGSQFRLGKLFESGKGVIQDYIEAHRWYNLAAAAGYTEAVSARDKLTSRMTPEQVAEAQRRARSWKPLSPGDLNKASKGLPPPPPVPVPGAKPVQKKTTVASPTAQSLHVAAASGNVNAVSAAIGSGVPIDSADKDGWTALMFAALSGHQDVVKILIDAKAGLDTQAKDGATALSMAAMRGHRDVVQMLLDAGADKGLKTAGGRTALELALAHGHKAVAKMMAASQAPVPQTQMVRLQKQLASLGYSPGPADGIPGKRTLKAAMAFARDNGFDADSGITADLISAVAARASQRGTARVASVSATQPSPKNFPEVPAVIYQHAAFQGAPPAQVVREEWESDDAKVSTSQLLAQDGVARRWTQDWGENGKSVAVVVLGGLHSTYSISNFSDATIYKWQATEVSYISGELFPMGIGKHLRFREINRFTSASTNKGTISDDACIQKPKTVWYDFLVERKLPGSRFGVPGDVYVVRRKERSVGYEKKYRGLNDVSKSSPGEECQKHESSSEITMYFAASLGVTIQDPMDPERGWKRKRLQTKDGSYLLADKSRGSNMPTVGEVAAAAKKGDAATVRRYLDADGDPNRKHDSETLLMIAAEHGHTEVARQLLDKGAKPDTVTEYSGTALLKAAENNRGEMVELLLDRGADPNLTPDNETTPALLELIEHEHSNLNAIKAMVARGANVNRADSYGNVPLHKAIYNDRTDIALVLLSAGADPNHLDDGETPLARMHRSISRNAPALVKALIQRGANVTEIDQRGGSLPGSWLIAACFADHETENRFFGHDEGLEVIVELLDAGARLTPKDMSLARELMTLPKGNTPSCHKLSSMLRSRGYQL